MNNNSRTISSVRKREQPWENSVPLMLYFPLSIFFMELIARVATFGELKLKQFFLILFLSISIGFVFSLIITVVKNKKIMRIVSVSILLVLGVVCCSQVVYYNIFGNYYSWTDIGMAGDAATQFADMLWSGIVKSTFPIILILVPAIIMFILRKRLTYFPVKRIPFLVSLAVGALASLFFIVSAIIICGDKNAHEGYFYYYNYPNSAETYRYYGILTGSRLNIQAAIFGEKIPPTHGQTEESYDDTIFRPKDTTDGTDTIGPDDTSGGEDSSDPIIDPVITGDNVMDIDFDSLIANENDKNIRALHEWLSSRKPTAKTKYTGMFKGKNLVFITLEGFSGTVIREDLTPTLYKMAHEGFDFENYYCSCWGGSTSTGEFANMTGLFYNSTACMQNYAANNYMPFVLGNSMNRIGYNSFAFHANASWYYKRNLSHPNLGYKFYAVGTGIENLTDANGRSFRNNDLGYYIKGDYAKPWPASDEFTAGVTLPTLINNQPFNAYYMSISGHANYNYGGNAMSSKHKNLIEEYCVTHNLNYNNETKAYLACQYEVELMVKLMIEEFDKAGILDNTVFVLAADHYPYGIINDATLAELYNLPEKNIRENYDLYRSALIIWSSTMKESVNVETACSAIDILPTVSNLFGLEFDSRLMMGTDILSGTDPIVILNCEQGPYWMWITSYGEYHKSGFRLNEKYEVDENQLAAYIKSINAKAANMKSYGFQMIKMDYYKYLKSYFERE